MVLGISFLTPAMEGIDRPVGAYRTYALVLYIASAAISFVALLYGLFILHMQPTIWENSIFKILIVVQVSNCLRFVFRILGTQADITAEFGCRAMLYLNNIFAIIPVYLSVYCVVYLQLVVVHKVSTKKRWPRILLLTICMVCSLGPNITILVIPDEQSGIDDYCNVPDIPGEREYWVTIGSSLIWLYIPGIIGVISMVVVSIHIFRTSSEVRRAQQDAEFVYGSWHSNEGYRNADMLNRTLISIVWFPLTPVVALWFNVILYSVRYYKKRIYIGAEFVSIALLTLESVFLAIALVVNPLVLDAARKRKQVASPGKDLDSRNGYRSSTYGAVTDVPSENSLGISIISALSHSEDDP